MSISVMMVVPKAPVLLLSKSQKTPVTRLANSTAMNGRAACLKFARTASPDHPQAGFPVLVAALEEVALELVGVSAHEVDLLVAEDLVAASVDAEATVADMALLLLVTMPGLPLHLQIPLLTTLLPMASAARLSMSAMYVLPSSCSFKHVADGHSYRGLLATKTW